MNLPLIIASYPRSGSTWLRFVLCHLFYPEVRHDFDSVNRFIPPIDHEEGLLAGVVQPLFYKTHGKTSATNVAFLFRHVGDVLESEYWFKRKHGEQKELRDFLDDCDYGAGWREMVEWYYPAQLNISYRDLDKMATYLPFCLEPSRIEAALAACTFEKMQAVEDEHGLGDYPSGDPEIKFCRVGKRNQWLDWKPDLKGRLLQKNRVQLKKLGYDLG